MSLIEVIIRDRIGNYQNGQVVEIPDGVFLRALLRGGKAEVLNPPDWSPENADLAKKNLDLLKKKVTETVKPFIEEAVEKVTETVKPFIEETVDSETSDSEPLKEATNGQSSSEQNSNRPVVTSGPTTGIRAGKKSRSSSTETSGDSAEGSGGFHQLPG